MTRKLQLLRGTTVQNDAFTGSSGELTVDTDTHELRVHDGSTAGGHVIPTKSEVYTQTQADTILAGKANTSLSNLTSTGANIGNWSSNVTNCITEIPQDIKLELNNGTLTLKAGSKVYVPNGAGVFDVVTIASDLTMISDTDGVMFVFIRQDGTLLFGEYNQESGTGTPAYTWTTYYNTNDNKVYRYTTSTTTPSYQASLPIAKITISGGVITSIDQVFNGFGYIGSTVFALPETKVLIPCGINSDGTLYNELKTFTSVKTTTYPGVVTYNNINIGITNNLDIDLQFLTYNEKENFNYNSAPQKVYESNVATLDIQSGRVTAFTPKTAFHAVDYSDYSNLVTTVNTKANDNAVVHLAGTETITGVKYFSQPIRRDGVFDGSGTSFIQATDTNGKGFIVNQAFYTGSHIINRMSAYNATSDAWGWVDVWVTDNGYAYATAPASDGWGAILITSAISKSQNGYVKLGNGIIIQWGHVDDPNNQHVYTVNLPTAFGSTNYKTMVITDHNTQSHSFLPNYINSAERTTTTFTVYRQGDARANSFEWIAIGY